jgi:hypothetical protein
MDYRTSHYLSKPLGKGLKHVIKIDVWGGDGCLVVMLFFISREI